MNDEYLPPLVCCYDENTGLLHWLDRFQNWCPFPSRASSDEAGFASHAHTYTVCCPLLSFLAWRHPFIAFWRKPTNLLPETNTLRDDFCYVPVIHMTGLTIPAELMYKWAGERVNTRHTRPLLKFLLCKIIISSTKGFQFNVTDPNRWPNHFMEQCTSVQHI